MKYLFFENITKELLRLKLKNDSSFYRSNSKVHLKSTFVYQAIKIAQKSTRAHDQILNLKFD